MNARQRLLDALNGNSTPMEPYESLIDAYAHELAEKQRLALPDVMERWAHFLHQDTISEVIDLIDPEAQSEKRHCGWEQAHESHRWIQNGVWYLCSTEVLDSE